MRVVDLLEVVEIEQDDRELHLVSARVRDLGGEPLLEVLAVVDAREPVASRRLVEPPLELLLGIVGDREAQGHVRPELDAIVRADLTDRDALPAEESAVRRAEILDEVAAIRAARHLRMPTTDAALVEPEVGLGASTEDVIRTVEREHLTRVDAADDRERRAVLGGGAARHDRHRRVRRAIRGDLARRPAGVGGRRREGNPRCAAAARGGARRGLGHGCMRCMRCMRCIRRRRKRHGGHLPRFERVLHRTPGRLAHGACRRAANCLPKRHGTSRRQGCDHHRRG